MEPAKRRWSSARLVVGALGVALVAGLGLGLVQDASEPGSLLSTLALLALAAAMVGMAVMILVAWRRMDEAAREAHKWAWYWGGSGGLFFAGLFVGLGGMLEAQSFRDWAPWPGDAGLVSAGVLLCVLLQTAGYMIAWVYWWLSRR